MARWQILLIKSFGVGLGIAVGVGLIFSGYLWWTARPKPDKPWNDKEISASYLRVSVTDDSFFSFYYSLKNNSDHDYRSAPSSEMRAMGKTIEGDITACEGCVEIPDTIFIPAHDQAQIHLKLKYKYPAGPLPSDGPARDIAGKALLAYLNDHYPRVNGFVIFDEVKRFKIILPPGWKR
jgi:hypothetical protein